MSLSIVASAPGSAMLFGEHAVLRGGVAIVSAIDCPLSVRLIPRDDTTIAVRSFLGSVTTTCRDCSFGPQFRFVEGAFRQYPLEHGFSVEITSAIDPTVGLASSAAVTVALLAALRQHVVGSVDRQMLLQEACQVIRSVQGHGSGADAASIVYGGVIAYRMDPIEVTPLVPEVPLVLLYSGNKTPTPEVIRRVNECESAFPDLYKTLFLAIDRVTDRAVQAFLRGRFDQVGSLMTQANGLMEALGVGTPELSRLCWALRGRPTIYGAKISGSGLGDAVVGLGTMEADCGGRRLPSTVSPKGVEVVVCNE